MCEKDNFDVEVLNFGKAASSMEPVPRSYHSSLFESAYD
jgi:hypothetical protein